MNFSKRETVKAAYERSDVCVVPAAAVAAEAMVALTMAQAALEKFGGDSLEEMQRNYRGYVETVAEILKAAMIYPIVKYPDKVLQKKAKPVTVFDAELEKLVDDMFESMYAAKGIGLAAPQIGIGKRLTVIDLSSRRMPEEKLVLINPEIIDQAKASSTRKRAA